MGYTQRRTRVLKALRALHGDAMVVTHGPDVRYLSGFTGSAGALVVRRGGRALLVTDGRYREQVRAEVQGIEVKIEQKAAALVAVGLAAELGLERCVFDAEHTTVAMWERMRGSLPRGRRKGWLVPSEGVVARLREVKDADEVEQMRRAAELGCALFDGVLGEMRPGMREVDVAAYLETEARRRGAEGMSFETIVASGERSALPHGRATVGKLPRKGFVTLDFGVVLDGYCSDMTRTVHMGRASREARAVYDSVLEAQVSAIAEAQPGAECAAVDEAARSVLRRAGLGELFVHSTGHGVGLEIHEGPRLAAKQEARLETGMVVTVEPGVYRAGAFGVRIEDMVLVRPEGPEILTERSPKALIEL